MGEMMEQRMSRGDVVANRAEVTVPTARRLIARAGVLFDLLLRRGEQRAHFARREHHRHAVLHRPLDLQLARRRLGDDPLLFEVPEEDLERRDFATDRRVAVRSGAELIEVLLEMLRRDLERGGRGGVGQDMIEMGIALQQGS